MEKLAASGNEAVFRGRVQLLWVVFLDREKRPKVRAEFELSAKATERGRAESKRPDRVEC
jgi:hypothetical protein